MFRKLGTMAVWTAVALVSTTVGMAAAAAISHQSPNPALSSAHRSANSDTTTTTMPVTTTTMPVTTTTTTLVPPPFVPITGLDDTNVNNDATDANQTSTDGTNDTQDIADVNNDATNANQTSTDGTSSGQDSTNGATTIITPPTSPSPVITISGSDGQTSSNGD